MTEYSDDDPRGLIYEAYRIDGITEPECRSIFLDWALSLPEGTPPADAAGRLLARLGTPDHPMNKVLAEAEGGPPKTGRRGGRRARLGAADASGSA